MSVDPADIIATFPKNRMEDVRVSLGEFRGSALVDVRTFAAFDGRPDRAATKKGVSLNVAHLPDLIEALQSAAAIAMHRGLIKAPSEQPRPWWDRD